MPAMKMKKKDLHDAFVTKEMFSIPVLMILKNILEDMIIAEPGSSAIKKRVQLVNSIRFTEDFSIENEYVVREMKYGFLKPGKRGRIYSEFPNVTQLSRDLRYYLFNNIYKDYDLKNCHPTILYEFVKNNLTISTPCLEEFVLSRDLFRDRVRVELPVGVDLKVSILVAFYSDDNKFESTSKTLKTLHKEIVMIRKHLHEHQASIHTDENTRLTRLQSYYCMTRESEVLTGLREFLLSKTNVNGLHFIPMYDGALIKHDDISSNMRLQHLVDEYNGTLDLLQFERKPIELPDDAVIDEQTFERYQNIYQFLTKLTVNKYSALLSELNMKPFKVEDNQLKFVIAEMDKMKEKQLKLKAELKTLNSALRKTKVDEEKTRQINAIRDSMSSTRNLKSSTLSDIRCISDVFRSEVRLKLLVHTDGCSERLKELLSKVNGKGD